MDKAVYPIAAYAFLALFVLATVFELFFAFKERTLYRKMVKPWCVLFLTVFAIVFLPNWHGALIMFGAFLGCVGDTLLLKKGHQRYFIAGAISFLFGHYCYIAAMLLYASSSLAPIHYIAFGLTFLLLIASLIVPMMKITKSKGVGAAGALYLSSLIMVPLIAFVLLGVTGQIHFLLIGLGGLSFLSSDCYLAKTRFIKHDRREDFYIMGTYLLAQFLIVFGLLLCFA